jgi:hypothetical protein
LSRPRRRSRTSLGCGAPYCSRTNRTGTVVAWPAARPTGRARPVSSPSARNRYTTRAARPRTRDATHRPPFPAAPSRTAPLRAVGPNREVCGCDAHVVTRTGSNNRHGAQPAARCARPAGRSRPGGSGPWHPRARRPKRCAKTAAAPRIARSPASECGKVAHRGRVALPLLNRGRVALPLLNRGRVALPRPNRG